MWRLITTFLFAVSVSIAQHGMPAKVTFVVRDDVGRLVTNAFVEGGFLDLSPSGARDRFRGMTDMKGEYLAKGNAVLGICAGFSSIGFYTTEINQTIERSHTQEQGHPAWVWPEIWEVKIPVLLKRIRKPTSMYMRAVENIDIRKRTGDKIGRIVTNSIVGYDLLRGDLVAPYGGGKIADLELRWQMMIISKDGDGVPVDYDTLFEARTTNVVDGICRGTPDGTENGKLGSAYISAYEAPIDGYTNVISFYRSVRGTRVEGNDDQHYLYYFRSRTQTNEARQVTTALYGKIYGLINGNFTYYLNPAPNDRNVEFDPTRNLFNDLSPISKADGVRP